MAWNSRFYFRHSKSLLFLLLLFFICINSSDMCPSLCQCGTQGGSKFAACHDVNFTTLPNDIPLDTNLLFLSNTKITSFSANSFSRLSHLIKIELSNNKIENITDGIFNGLTNLKTLNLPNNGIRRISSHAFSGLTSLIKLTLSSNELTSLPVDMLRDQANLRTLNLDNNQLRTFPNGFLNSAVNLTTIHLNKNEIQSIENKAFEPAGNTLFMLNLENNRLRSVPRALYAIKSPFIIQIGLGSNFITLIQQEAEAFFDKVKNSYGKISLSGNPLVCKAGLQWLQTWIKQNQRAIKDPDDVMCATMDGKTTKLIDYDFNSTAFPMTTASTTTITSTTTASTTARTTTIRHTSPRTTLKLKSSASTQSITTTTTTVTTSKLLSDSLTSTSRVMSTTEALTEATDVITRISQNVTSTQEMPAIGSASSANITRNNFTKPTPKTDEADMTALERNKHIILATCLSAAFIALVVFLAMYCFRNKIVKRDKVLSTRYDRVRIV